MDDQQLRDIATQLARPHGEKGLEMAEMMYHSNLSMIRQSIHHLQLADAQHILELGHANAAHLTELLATKSALQYMGLEISALMQQRAIVNNPLAIQMQQAVFNCYDGTHIPAPAQYFDRIFSVNTVYFWQQPQQLMDELYRVLKIHGRLNLTFAQKTFMQSLPFTRFEFQLYTLDEVLSLSQASQFQPVAIHQGEDEVISKAGERVQRKFVTLSLQKTGN